MTTNLHLIDEGFHDLELLKKVITQIKKDDSIGDYTAIDYLFKDITRDHLEGFLTDVDIDEGI